MNTAIITGASSGIGWELAHVFARHGHDLILIARRKDRLEKLAEELSQEHKIKAQVVTADLSIPGAAKKLYQEIQALNMSPQYLINNAGFGESGYFLETDWQKEHAMMQLNIVALTDLTKFFVQDFNNRQMTSQEKCTARIINVASTAAFQPGPTMAVYFASKAYVLSFSEAIAEEFKKKNITVTTLCPGATASEFFDVANMTSAALKIRPIPSSKEVAEFGFKKMMQGQRIAIHGKVNNLIAFATRFMPYSFQSWITNKVLNSH